MASAYSTIANYGIRVENYLIERIEDADGNVVYQHQVDAQPGARTGVGRRGRQHHGEGRSRAAPGAGA